MAMMACFALYRLDERAFVLLPGNLAVFVGLAGGALALGLQRRLWLPISLLGAVLTAGMGLFSLSQSGRPLSWMRLPGAAVMWVVIGLYCAFRLALIYQAAERKKTELRQDKLREKQLQDEDGTPRAATPGQNGEQAS